LNFNPISNALSMTGLNPASIQIDDLTEQVDENTADIALIQIDLANISAEIIVINGHITTIDGNITNIQGDITTIEGDITTIEGDITTIESDITTIQGDITTIQGDITTIEGDITSLTTQVNTNTNNISSLTTQVNTNTNNISSLTTQVNTNTSNIATNTSNIATNTNNITELAFTVNTNTANILTNTADIADINYNINEISYLEEITNINTHGDQYGENGEIWNSNGFDTIDYTLTQINLPATTYFFTTSFPNGGSLKVFQVQTPSANNQIVKYRFQIPITAKANGSCTTAVNDVNLSCAVPTQYFVIKNGDFFNPIVGSITSHMGGDHLPKRFNTIATGAWSFEVYLYTLFIEFTPPASNPNDIYEIFIDITFNCYSLGTANPQRLCSLTRAGYNLNTSLKPPYYTLSNLVPTTTVEEDPFCVQGFNSVVLNPQIATNTASISSLQTQVTNLSNYVYNSLVPAVFALQTGLVDFVNSQVYIMPCLYPESANVNYSRLFVQQFLNVSVNDPMNSFTCPYIFSYSHFVLCCDNTAFQPAYCRIEIKVSSNNGANIWAYIGKEYNNFQFQNKSDVISLPTITWAEVPIGTQLNFDIEFFSNSGSSPLSFGPEYILYPYCNRRPFYTN